MLFAENVPAGNDLSKMRGLKLRTLLEMQPHQGLVLLATLFLIRAKMPLALLATWAVHPCGHVL